MTVPRRTGTRPTSQPTNAENSLAEPWRREALRVLAARVGVDA